jgi:hypothetical protein
MKYLLQCRPHDEKGMVLPSGHQEGLGYKYADIVIQPDPGVDTQKGEMVYNYSGFNNDTKLRIFKDDPMTMTFDFRDFKYLS